MKLRASDMIDRYIESEVERLTRTIMREKKGVLLSFAFFMDELKEDVWQLSDTTEEDARKYYKKLKDSRPDAVNRNRSVQILNHFMDYAAKQGWIKKRPWKELSRQRMAAGDEEKLVELLRERYGKNAFELRDRAMTLLYLKHGVTTRELSTLSAGDYRDKAIRIRRASCEEIKLADNDSYILDEYLMEREGEGIKEEALFTGEKSEKRLTRGSVGRLIRAYIAALREEEA